MDIFVWILIVHIPTKIRRKLSTLVKFKSRYIFSYKIFEDYLHILLIEKFVETIPLQYGNIYAYNILSILITMVKTSIAPRHFNAIKVFSKSTEKDKKGKIWDRTICDKTVRCNQKRLVCEHCLEMCHVKCSSRQPNQNTSNKAYEWTCPNCIHTALPLYNRRNPDFDSTVANKAISLNTNNCHTETLKNHQKYTSIAHINCQSTLSTFDEFAGMMKSCESDIIFLSETWLTNNQHQLDYVNIAGYKSIFKHRKDKKRGV